ncbi:hypothetical protein CVD28_03790 [Bacillus sp. M6-12]|uniref:hypothetical protein n=1 Tax=Bacillus sp. M6-12 TaxID=2054166 RepID=UPI000C78BE04|nr:hypothetical protein [Bacillus sp. M6-12]PLS19549.1 hypothetical protein CVD28_03790 [Bacillus sp. M6-12]
MIDSLIAWLGSIDWNALTETAIEHVYILYLLPFPIILIGTYYFFKSVSLPSFWLRGLSAILVTLCFGFYHKKHITDVPKGEIDFGLIEAVAYEYMIGSAIALLAIFIFMVRSIVSSIKGRAKKKAVQATH